MLGLVLLLTGTALRLGLRERGTAQAFEAWCFDVPVVAIAGVSVQTTTGTYNDPTVVERIARKATYVYELPKGVSGQLLSQTRNYFKEKVQFAESSVAWTPGQPIPVTLVTTY